MKNEMNSVSIFLPTNVSARKMVPNVSHVPACRPRCRVQTRLTVARANVVTGRLCRVGMEGSENPQRIGIERIRVDLGFEGVLPVARSVDNKIDFPLAFA